MNIIIFVIFFFNEKKLKAGDSYFGGNPWVLNFFLKKKKLKALNNQIFYLKIKILTSAGLA